MVRYAFLAVSDERTVLISAPGHTLGSQWVFVQLSSGQEYLFVGDTASLMDNIHQMKIRSRYVTSHIGIDDRKAVMLQTQALHELAKDQPEFIIVPGHDGAEIEALIARGTLDRGFTLP